MKLLKELGVRSNGKRGYMWALFECPKCLKTLERMKHQGVNQEQCQECFRAHHINKLKLSTVEDTLDCTEFGLI